MIIAISGSLYESSADETRSTQGGFVRIEGSIRACVAEEQVYSVLDSLTVGLHKSVTP
jgi:hypothetical protein